MQRTHRTRATAALSSSNVKSSGSVPHSGVPPPSLLKTCQTCFRAKIRCDRTQDSGSCDRCLRLEKECVFVPVRRRNAPAARSNRADRLEARTERVAGHPTARSRSASQLESRPVDQSRGQTVPRSFGDQQTGSFDPVETGILDAIDAEALVVVFRQKMSPQFPFVIVPEDATADAMRDSRQCLLLAVLAVASFHHPARQRTLSRSFNQLVASRLVDGSFASLDMLQGLLVHLAWAHYQPRPRRFSQHLNLAVSIVSDLRLDRPKNPRLWNVDKSDERNDLDWGTEEVRAAIGTYYLCSSSSIVLQKLSSFPYSPYLPESSQRLGTLAEHPVDKYLQYIVELQRMSEELDGIVSRAASALSVDDVNIQIAKLRENLDVLKATFTFPLSECPTLSLQINTLELFISQVLLPGFPFGIDKHQRSIPDGQQLVSCLSDSISACKSLINIFPAMVSGEEFAMTNTCWIMMSCALSLAVRVDVLARDTRLAHLTKHLQRFLDIRHTLKQVVLRLQSVTMSEGGGVEEPDPFAGLLRRARKIESWYLRQPGVSNLTSPATQSTPGSVGHEIQPPISIDLAQADLMPGLMSAMPLEHDLGSDLSVFGEFSIMDFFDADAQMLNFGPYLDPLNFGYPSESAFH